MKTLLKICVFIIICVLLLLIAQIRWIKSGDLLWFYMNYYPFSFNNSALILYDYQLVYCQIGAYDCMDVCAIVVKSEADNSKAKGFIGICGRNSNFYYRSLKMDEVGILFYDVKDKNFKEWYYDGFKPGDHTLESTWVNFDTLESDNMIFDDQKALFNKVFIEMSNIK